MQIVLLRGFHLHLGACSSLDSVVFFQHIVNS